MSGWRFVNPLAATTFLPDSKYIALAVLQLSGPQRTATGSGGDWGSDRRSGIGERVVRLRRCHV